MAKRCKHADVVVEELFTATWECNVVNGKVVDTGHDEPRPTGDWTVECTDCGTAWRGSPTKVYLKWVRVALEAAMALKRSHSR